MQLVKKEAFLLDCMWLWLGRFIVENLMRLVAVVQGKRQNSCSNLYTAASFFMYML